ncbi:type VI secretion system protein TssA [Zooshikella ganghwensis]|uniref:Type VI secretion system protein TssA n=1 Tax=Zooshikella ganghwensis TaxID=202772 RepID=A0A4P9VQH9_9GAMM|nr:type VI secretion system protein TssA [Zooshikella ganghwensis]RDH45773.1 type VI secretion system protein TssA [Zooshikella ganghwensis]
MSELDVSYFQQVATAKLPEDAPSGSDARYASTYETLEAEFAKLTALTDQGSVTWKKVVSQAEEHLQHQSKDILVACYLCRALYEMHGFEGLFAGFQMLNSFIEQCWDIIFPPKKRIRARASALEWLLEDLHEMVGSYKPVQEDLAKLSKATEAVKALEQQVNDIMGDHAPALGPFRRLLTGFIEDIELSMPAQPVNQQPESSPSQNADTSKTASSTEQVTAQEEKQITKTKPQAQKPETKATSTSVKTDIKPLEGDLTDDRECNKALRTCQDYLRQIAAYKREQQLSDAFAYEINRYAAWLNVWQLPRHQQGKTDLRPIPKDKRIAYENLMANGQYQKLVDEVENSISKAPFWLDGHRLVAEALLQLGFQEAYEAVITQTASFLRKFPELLELTFFDQMPFADEETKDWVKSTVLVNNKQSSSSQLQDMSQPWLEAFKEAKALASKKQIQEALCLFRQGLRSASPRESMYWKLQQAQFCFDIKKYELACPILEEMDRYLVTHHLDQWEPELCIQVLSLLLRSYKRLPDKKVAPETIESLHARLCCFDVAAALEL